MNRVVSIVFLAGILASSSHADPYPHRKPGLWLITMTLATSKLPPMVSKYCIDAATESAMMDLGQNTMKTLCSRQDVRFTNGKGTTDTVCKIGKSVQTAHTDVTFSGNVAYHSETKSHMQPPLFGKADSSSTVDAKWVGQCPASMSPGDIVMANGIKMHMGGTPH
jgi:hypothetical protein